MEPRGVDALKRDPDVARELAAGAFLISIPYIPDDDRIERINITMSRGLLLALDAEAGRRKMKRSALIAKAVRGEVTAG